jgi:hypothetical protein
MHNFKSNTCFGVPSDTDVYFSVAPRGKGSETLSNALSILFLKKSWPLSAWQE